MPLHDIDPVDDVARPDGTRATADLTQADARERSMLTLSYR